MLAYLKFRWVRAWRRLRRELRVIGLWLQNYFERHLWGKWRHLGIIRRLVTLWWGSLIILAIGVAWQIGVLQSQHAARIPLSGGVYSEALIGDVKTLNPILPESMAASSANRLIFSGLTRYNPKRQLEPDLASSWEVSSNGLEYTFHLRHNVAWHDGVPFTAQDVAFTLAAIQNPDSRSPLASSWQGVNVDIKDDYTVVFRLPNPYPPFLTATTVGIVPRHLLESIEPAHLRAADFNQHPIGTGPFALASFSSADHVITLKANDKYYGGRPRINEFVFREYHTAAEAREAYAKHQVLAISRLEPSDQPAATHLKDLENYDMSLPELVGAFFRTTAPNLADKAVRTALVQSINRSDLLATVLADNGQVASAPLLPGQLGYNGKLQQPGFNEAAAATALDAAGWTLGKDHIRHNKTGQPLQLSLVTSDTGAYPQVANYLRDHWTKFGIKVTVTVVDRTSLQQSYIRPRNYDILLYGINIGADPDVYSYWHSSQVADPGQNLSAYSSTAVDKALESARINSDSDIRLGKYAAFLSAWRSDNPALILYSPNYVYAVSRQVMGIRAHKLVDPTDRFYGVEHWTVRATTVVGPS